MFRKFVLKVRLQAKGGSVLLSKQRKLGISFGGNITGLECLYIVIGSHKQVMTSIKPQFFDKIKPII